MRNNDKIVGLEKDRLVDGASGIDRGDIFITRTKEVPVEGYSIIRQAIGKIIAETRSNLRITDYGSFKLHNGDYGSPDWYQGQALTGSDKGFGQQVDAVGIDRLLRSEPYQRDHPHYDVMVVDKDLRTDSDDNNFVYGIGSFPNVVLSTRRFMNIRDTNDRLASLANLAAHELGHVLGLTHRSWNRGTSGMCVGHCAGEKGPCLMEQVDVPGQRTAVKQARKVIVRENWLCEDCTEEIEMRRKAILNLGLRW